MILADTSAWIEFLRSTGSSTNVRLRWLIDVGDVATTEVVVMELLAGARFDAEFVRLRRLLYGCELLPIEGAADHERAAEIYRTCRRAGETIRGMNDCLVGAIALRADVDVLALDADFSAIARHTSLRLDAV